LRVSDRAEGSDNGEVIVGGVGAALGKARHGDGGGGARAKAKTKGAGKTTERRARGRVGRKGSGGDDGVVGT